MRHKALVGTMASIGSLAAGPLGAQHVGSVAPKDTQAVAERVAARRSPATAALLGLVFPGAGHWYAREAGRGTVIAAVYWTGVAVVAGGRTDTIGHVGGALAIGAVGVSVVDGARAARRHNARLTVTPRPGGSGARGSFGVRLTIPWRT